MTAASRSLAYRDARSGDEPAIRAVVAAVRDELGVAAHPEWTDADLEDVVASYGARGGIFRVLLADDGRMVGCGGLYMLDATQAEIRKMYLLPEARGRGLGRVLLDELVTFARAQGFRRVVLETASVLERAIAMYRRYGFEPVMARASSHCDCAMALDLVR